MFISTITLSCLAALNSNAFALPVHNTQLLRF